MKKLLFLVGFILVTLPVFSARILFMKPVYKNVGFEIEETFEKNMEKVLRAKYSYVSHSNISERVLSEGRRCGSDPRCWGRVSRGSGFDYVLLSLVEKTDIEEYNVHFVVLDITRGDRVGNEQSIYPFREDLSARSLWSQMKNTTSRIYSEVKKDASRSRSPRRTDRRDSYESERERRERERREREMEEKRRREEEERRRRLEEERKRRQEELERKRMEAERRREEERRRREEEERRRRLEEERKRREQQREKEKLERLRQQREDQRRKEHKMSSRRLEQNEKKLRRGREIILELYSSGKYDKAVEGIVKLSELKCDCIEDSRTLALKTQLLSFNKIRNDIRKGIEMMNHSLILDNIAAAEALDREISGGGTEFSERLDSIKAIGHLARARKMEEEDHYVLAKNDYKKCLEFDPGKKECREWLDNLDNVAKKMMDRAKVFMNFNPSKGKSMLKQILKLVNADSQYYKEAENLLRD
ncbi:MAG: hypothetical protein R6W70_02540 [bacterium]